MIDYLNRLFNTLPTLPNKTVLKCIDDKGRYWIASDGYVLSLCHEEPLIRKFHDNGKGYLSAKIDGRTQYLHRLLALHFNENKEKKKLKRNCFIHHLDRNKKNNSLSNLCIITPEQHHKIHNIWRQIDKLEAMRCQEQTEK